MSCYKSKSADFSVLMAVHYSDSSSFLDDAISSIWDRQTLRPEQIVVVKDGEVTLQINNVLERWRKKIGHSIFFVVELPTNGGLASALNAGLEVCRCDIVARMDSDDVSLPLRFEKQICFMRNNENIVAISSQVEECNLNLGEVHGVRKLPCNHEEIMLFAKKRSPLSHPAAVFRKQFIIESGGYPDIRKGQDYALWSLLLSKGYRLANLPSVLLKMRCGQELHARRGLDYLKHEFDVLLFQKKIGFLSWFEFLRNLILKVFLRTSPIFVKKFVYKKFR
ncbi:glycosyltransferase [Halomonas sp. DP1Y21-3]|uniref:glycosyltransferase n=1 Tax=Halomonas sp. DP1Y21-3 TaxID=2859080 RepID=UPI001C94C4BF|nr:glycosyltransferase [Halomonas sp. DP1Y21-3]MBY6112815.1 glycosyltransferase [Halomonas sp. DP1Y21-3]